MSGRILAEYQETLYTNGKKEADILLKYELEKAHNFIDKLCPNCSSKESKKNGVYLSPRGNKQKWECKKCKTHFTTMI